MGGPATKTPPTRAVASDPLSEALRRVARCESAVAGIRAERSNLRWFLVLAVIAPLPVWLLLEWRMALAATAAALLSWLVGQYLNVMHVRSACQYVEDARMDLIRLERTSSGAAVPIAS